MNATKCLWYRCRQCGADFASLHECWSDEMPNRVMQACDPDGAHWLRHVHYCGPDRLGLADLIGSAPTPVTANQVATS